MFGRIYLYRIKASFREPVTLFWSLIFPYLLAVIFAIVILPMGKLQFEPLKVAVVQNNLPEQDSSFKAFFDELSAADSDMQLLEVEYTDEEEAVKQLNSFAISGFFTTQNDGTLELALNRSDIEQTILRSIADSYNQISKVVGDTLQKQSDKAEVILSNLQRVDTTKLLQDNRFREDGNIMAVYFFALIGMYIMYAMNFALIEVTYMQGNLSYQGARVLVSPSSKVSLLLASLSAAFTIQMTNSVLFMIFLDKIIGIPVLRFGLPLWVLLAVANLTTIAMGSALATLVKGNMEVKISLAIGVSMLCSFLAGLMTEGVRFLMINTFPRLARLNPAELIADSFYSLYFFADQARVWENCLILAALAIIFSTMSLFKLRRSNYASI